MEMDRASQIVLMQSPLKGEPAGVVEGELQFFESHYLKTSLCELTLSSCMDFLCFLKLEAYTM